jgi:hypothetical protein
VEITVTDQNILDGTQCDPCCCPVSWALMNAGFPDAAVSSKEIYLYGVESSLTVETPGPVRRRINYYDRTGNMKPFKFELAV